MPMKIPLELSDEAIQQIGTVMQEMALKAFKVAGKRQQFNPYMTKKEAAQYLHVSPVTLAAFIRQGLPVVVVGNIRRISRTAADQFMVAHQL
ncbi:helix-turn-helix domain-containing protein [Levilactobacillus acidifarinae]|uniref:Helix-turn-helix domain-containing protein n=1 Tax=Levilactobacillus acidifarinae DSM 19394 = JCM 15949 TaxID=1423715 RepID=A0A0R1LKI6_9LACO|nr:helix-turn-helix domain-containing protein [Levilactobacillus acidifarinae]KRK96325.1 hypothetical protein FD25_GL001813 [Levilactobacillus acidifarinae DSM 19394]GEO69092.1 hypothetical protein LAC03_10020 [Levilactobacillus acidifarinae]